MKKMKHRSLAEFYAKYPYPSVKEIFFDRNLVNQHYYLAGGRAPAKGRILVAGCGTTEALTWALSAPDYKVDAVDISKTSVKIARRLAEQLEVSNLNIRRSDFTDGEGLKGSYDVISSLGVVHHLKKPERGLAKLGRRLAPGGVMSLMVYTHTNRATIQDAQRVIRLLTPDDDAQSKEATAVRVCEAAQHGAGRLSGTFERALEERTHTPASFADTMLNPREVSYSIPELSAMLNRCDLEIASPVHPFAWIPYGHLGAEELARFHTLPLLQRMEIADLLCNPLCWVVVQRRGARAKAKATPDFWSLVPCPLDSGSYAVDALTVQHPAVPSRIDVQRVDPETVALARSPRYPARFHPLAAHMLALVDGTRDLTTIATLGCQAEGLNLDEVRDEVELTLRTMMHDMGLFTPAQT